MYFTCIERVRAVGLRLDPSFRRNDAGAWRTWCRRGRPPWCRRYQRCFHPECWTRSGSSWPANNIINWIVILSSIDGARLSLQKLTLPAIFHANKSGYWLKFSTSNNFTSLNGHWLKYRRCARLIEQKTGKCYISIRIYITWIS